MSSRGREVAKRVFAQEFNRSTFSFKESDEDRAPNYVLLPTGSKANRVFIVGTLTETEDLSDESEYWRARVVDPVGTFFVYASYYQPQPLDAIKSVEPPVYASVVGKPSTYETDDGSVNVSLRPESITFVNESVRTRWIIETGERTLDRIQNFDDTNEYAVMARENYEPDMSEYKQMVIDALESVTEKDGQ